MVFLAKKSLFFDTKLWFSSLGGLFQYSNINSRLPIGPIEESNLLNLFFFPIWIRKCDKNSQSDEIFNTIVVEPDWPHCPIGQGWYFDRLDRLETIPDCRLATLPDYARLEARRLKADWSNPPSLEAEGQPMGKLLEKLVHNGPFELSTGHREH